MDACVNILPSQPPRKWSTSGRSPYSQLLHNKDCCVAVHIRPSVATDLAVTSAAGTGSLVLGYFLLRLLLCTCPMTAQWLPATGLPEQFRTAGISPAVPTVQGLGFGVQFL